ncbi:MAG: hypothetical protein ACYDAC_11990 [Candidatus Dormibacteria bacterium]
MGTVMRAADGSTLTVVDFKENDSGLLGSWPPPPAGYECVRIRTRGEGDPLNYDGISGDGGLFLTSLPAAKQPPGDPERWFGETGNLVYDEDQPNSVLYSSGWCEPLVTDLPGNVFEVYFQAPTSGPLFFIWSHLATGQQFETQVR